MERNPENRLIRDAWCLIRKTIEDVMPEKLVREAIGSMQLSEEGRLVLISVGKASLRMAKAALDVLSRPVDRGCVITVRGQADIELPPLRIFRAGHPVPDIESYRATDYAVNAVNDLRREDTVLFLLSGGASALFESSDLEADEYSEITGQLLRSGAEVHLINTIRKHLSNVKGGRFAEICAPARVEAIILSDVIGDEPDTIASGPVSPDRSTVEQAIQAAEDLGIELSKKARKIMNRETPKTLSNVDAKVIGGVGKLCGIAAGYCADMGYNPVILTDRMTCEAREAGSFLASIAYTHRNDNDPVAFIAGGETVVYVKGKGKGGRNQEIALSAAAGIEGMGNVCVFSFGSDGIDGNTDAAGGIVTGNTAESLRRKGISINRALRENDSYNALREADALIKTGPTGTNVNDLSVILIRNDE